MRIHDWTQVTAGTFHDFHSAWITHLKEALNLNLLPPGFYAMAEQHAGWIIPDILTLTSPEWATSDRVESNPEDYAVNDNSNISPPLGAVALADAPPQVSFRSVPSEAAVYREKRRTISIRQEPSNRVVAMIEIISPGNKDCSKAVREFVTKSLEVMNAGIHLLIVDLFPTSASNPEGLNALLWGDPFTLPADRRLTLASYRIDVLNEAFIEPVAVGQEMPDMPIFLNPAWYVNVPLAGTYESAWRGMPKPFQRILDAIE
jgi:hypothetical protein